MSNKLGTPWLWVPTLYFAEGIPYFIVNTISVVLFTKLGVPNGTMALYTSLLYLPWVIKPLWSPFVDVIRTKRWWIITMQLLISMAFIGLTIFMPHPAQNLITAQQTPISLFKVMLVLFWLTAFASATHDIAADGYYMIALNDKQQALFVGIRSLFYRLASIFGQGVLIAIAGILETRCQSIPQAWQLTMLIAAVLFSALTLWHTFLLPTVEAVPPEHKAPLTILKEFGQTFLSFFKKKGIVLALAFMLLYRLPEAFLVKMLNPFLLHDPGMGGLGLSTAEVGLYYGTIGVAALTLGGIIGGICAAKWGLKRSMLWMVLAITLPDALYLWLSISHPVSHLWTILAITIEQFGYGFGFTAYMLYMIYFSQGAYKTAHYAICTGFMALGMMLPGMVAGYIQEAVGYSGLFWIVMFACLVSIIIALIAAAKMPSEHRAEAARTE